MKVDFLLNPIFINYNQFANIKEMIAYYFYTNKEKHPLVAYSTCSNDEKRIEVEFKSKEFSNINKNILFEEYSDFFKVTFYLDSI